MLQEGAHRVIGLSEPATLEPEPIAEQAGHQVTISSRSELAVLWHIRKQRSQPPEEMRAALHMQGSAA